MRHLGLSLALVASLTVAAVAPAAAAKPEHSHDPAPPLVLDEGPCDFPVVIDNAVDRGKTTVFAAAPSGSERTLVRGFFEGLITNTATGATHSSVGGASVRFVFYPDGSIRADGMGTSFVAWYFEGDDVNVEAGLYDVNGHVTEWYAADGSFIRAVVHGKATNLCEVLG